jgi:hypothetical protein
MVDFTDTEMVKNQCFIPNCEESSLKTAQILAFLATKLARTVRQRVISAPKALPGTYGYASVQMVG